MKLYVFSLLAATTGLCWWLSRFDHKVTGQDPGADFARRFIRTGLSLLLLIAGLYGGPLFIAVPLLLALIWAGCVSDLFSRGVHSFVDAEDKRELDSDDPTRALDKLAQLVKEGRHDEAIALSRRLSDTGHVSLLAMETFMHRVYSRMFEEEEAGGSTQMAEAIRLRRSGKPSAAAATLAAILRLKPSNVRAAFLLLRIQACDLNQPQAANATLQQIARRCRFPACFLQHARRSIQEWTHLAPSREQSEHGIESLLVNQPKATPQLKTAADPTASSIDQLLANGHLDTAIKWLEQQIEANPRSLDLWLKLVEAHGVYCGNIRLAGKIITQMEAHPALTRLQVDQAKSKFQDWARAAAV